MLQTTGTRFSSRFHQERTDFCWSFMWKVRDCVWYWRYWRFTTSSLWGWGLQWCSLIKEPIWFPKKLLVNLVNNLKQRCTNSGPRAKVAKWCTLIFPATSRGKIYIYLLKNIFLWFLKKMASTITIAIEVKVCRFFVNTVYRGKYYAHYVPVGTSKYCE